MLKSGDEVVLVVHEDGEYGTVGEVQMLSLAGDYVLVRWQGGTTSWLKRGLLDTLSHDSCAGLVAESRDYGKVVHAHYSASLERYLLEECAVSDFIGELSRDFRGDDWTVVLHKGARR